MKKTTKILSFSVLLLVLLVLPHLFTMDYYLHIFVMSEIYAVLALSLALIVGFSGQVSMGHAAFYGIGARLRRLCRGRSGSWSSGSEATCSP